MHKYFIKFFSSIFYVILSSHFCIFVANKAYMENASHGGKREKAGRKPVADKKVLLTIYPHKSRIDALGATNAKEIAINAIEKEFKKKKQ